MTNIVREHHIRYLYEKFLGVAPAGKTNKQIALAIIKYLKQWPTKLPWQTRFAVLKKVGPFLNED